MEDALRKLYDNREMKEQALGILLIRKESGLEGVTNYQDAIILVIKTQFHLKQSIEHHLIEGKKVAVHIVSWELCKEWLMIGNNPQFIDWFFNGTILYQVEHSIEMIKNSIRELPIVNKEKKIGLEYAKLIREREAAKMLYETDNYLDSYFHIMRALNHQARLSVIEKGFIPELTVWKQVKYIEPEIYKLYQEMLEGEELLAKKIELALLATEFSITAKLNIGAAHIIKVMINKSRPLTIEEMLCDKELYEYRIELELLLEHLLDRGIIVNVFDHEKSIRYYKINEKLLLTKRNDL